MCGRFVSASPPDELARYFDVAEVAVEPLEPSYNVAPTRDVYVVLVEGGVRRLEAHHWGLIPSWAKDRKVGARMINARADTVAEKPAFKKAFARRRCIVPADAFYEWLQPAVPKAKKQPVAVHRVDGEPLAFAGLWERWKPRDAEGNDTGEPWVRSCTIITGPPNERIAEFHDRMPVLLPPSTWERWLDPGFDDLDALGALLVPAPSELLTVHPVSARVNSVQNDDSSLVLPFDPDAADAAAAGEQPTLLLG